MYAWRCKFCAGIFLLALLAPSVLGEWQGDKMGWRPVPMCHLTALVSIVGMFGEHVCLGTAVHRMYVLTAAHCLEASGPMPVIRAIHGNCSTGPQEFRAEQATYHPSWTGNITNGYDVALLRLPMPLNVQLPLVASREFDLYPNTIVDMFRLQGELYAAKSVVVAGALCPHLRDMAPQTFCTYSQSGSMAAGGPVMIREEDGSSASPNSRPSDVLVGVVSHANYSSLQDSGVGCTGTMDLKQWIESVAGEADCPPPCSPMLINRCAVAMAASIVIVALAHAVRRPI